MEKEKVKPSEGNQELLEKPKELILFNDDVNTFDFVIETLIDVCEHDNLQAEQCAWVTHYRGKCGVKSGTMSELKPVKNEMINRKLTVEIN